MNHDAQYTPEQILIKTKTYKSHAIRKQLQNDHHSPTNLYKETGRKIYAQALKLTKSNKNQRSKIKYAKNIAQSSTRMVIEPRQTLFIEKNNPHRHPYSRRKMNYNQ